MKTAGRVIAEVALLGLVILAALSLCNLAVTSWQHARNPVPGKFYSVEGRRMHLYCSGAGSPTIVIEAGLGSDWLGWQGVQPKLAQVTRVCTYDRSGLGWSEPAPRPRDAETIARQLHELLDTAGIPRPLVLMGHSAGGFYIREYAREFPSEVAGVVLVDSVSPQQIDELPGFRASYEEDKRNAVRDLWVDRLRVWSGWERLAGNCNKQPPKDLINFSGQWAAQRCRPAYVDGDFGEYMDFETADKQASRLTSFGRIPLLVLSRDPDRRKAGMSANAVAGMPVWDREQESLKSLSPMSWRVIARGSGHDIYHDRPELLVGEVGRLMDYLRGGPTPPFGSTMIE